jgi:uncharacterized HAD superfamily protein
MKRKIIRVGFDLDGVLLYNPARIVRPIISLMKKKKVLIDRDELEFYVPKPGLGQFFWELFHKSSMCLAPGFKQIEQLKNQQLIEPYLITGRFAHLKKDYLKWKRKMKADQLFAACYMNNHDEQPHLFKERMIKELNLDFFIEDNWDIVQHLNQNLGQKQVGQNSPKIIWLSNVLDFRINYYAKANNLRQALSLINFKKNKL